MQAYELKQGDCLELMKEIPDGSVDLILCDLPYGTTNCSWDFVIPWEPLWAQYRRIIRPAGTIALFSAQPFTVPLINSNLPNYKYSWYWKKNNVTGGPFAKVQPMRCIEEINIFRYDLGRDNAGLFPKTREYLQAERVKTGKTLKELQELLESFMTSHYFTNGAQFSLPTPDAYKRLQTTGFFQMPFEELKALYLSEMPMPTGTEGEIKFTYNPQGISNEKTIIKKSKRNGEVYGDMYRGAYTQDFTGYPHHLLQFDNEAHSGGRLHPTQKPVNLCEYLVKTYTNEGDVVLDNCMGSGTTGVACMKTKRRFIGIEMNDKYFEIASKRIEEALNGIKVRDELAEGADGQLALF